MDNGFRAFHLSSVRKPEPVLFSRSRSRCKDVKEKTCFLLLFSLFLYEEELEPVKKVPRAGGAGQKWIGSATLEPKINKLGSSTREVEKNTRA